MKRRLVAGALMSLGALGVVCQEVPDSLDEFKFSVDLHEITVKSIDHVRKADRNVILPSKEVRDASVNARDMIGRLHIPRISLNPLTGEIGMADGGKVTITINGVLSSSMELASVPPGDIVKIEHIDSPGPRYPDTKVLINVVTRRYVSGGNVSVDFLNAFKKGGECDIDNLALSHSFGKSQISYSGQLMHLRRDNWARDYYETRVSPDRIIEIEEIGEPSLMELANIENALAYSLADGDRYMFNAKLGLGYDNVPHSEEADRTTIRKTSGEDETLIYEHMGERSLLPSVDIYGQYRFDNGGTLLANIVGTYIKSKNTHVYRQETSDGVNIAGINSEINGHKYSLISELGYSQMFGMHKLSFGARHHQVYAENKYLGDVEAVIGMRQAETSLYGKYSAMFGNVSVMGAAGVKRFYNSQDVTRQSQFIFTPSMALSWTPFNDLSLGYRMELQGKMPSLGDMNNVAQMIDPGYYRQGNPGLRAFRVLGQEFSAAWQWKWLSIDLSVPFTHEYKPVMESVEWINNAFVRIAENQKSFTRIGAEATLTVRPLSDYVTVSLIPSVDRYHSRGNDFDCRHTIKNLRVDVEFNYKHWQLMYNTLTGYANYMYGTRLMRERNMSMIMAGYKSERFSIKAGVLDPFVKKYWMETRDMAPLINSVSKAYSTRPTYFTIQLSLNLSYGRGNGQNHEKEIENSDKDSGLLKGVK